MSLETYLLNKLEKLSISNKECIALVQDKPSFSFVISSPELETTIFRHSYKVEQKEVIKEAIVVCQFHDLTNVKISYKNLKNK